jgi:ABC-type polysaccharide transport system permease subunit
LRVLHEPLEPEDHVQHLLAEHVCPGLIHPLGSVLAIALNETGSKVWRKSVQMVTYAPYFISTWSW